MPLANVADIRCALVPDLRGRNARLLQQRRTFRLHFAEQGIGLLPIKHIEMPRPRAHEAEGKDGETMWILSTLQCMDASGIRHAFIHNLVDAPGCLLEREA